MDGGCFDLTARLWVSGHNASSPLYLGSHTGSTVHNQNAPVCIIAQSPSLQSVKMKIKIATDKNIHSILYTVTSREVDIYHNLCHLC